MRFWIDDESDDEDKVIHNNLAGITLVQSTPFDLTRGRALPVPVRPESQRTDPVEVYFCL